jgi:hypothetical protein
MVTPVSLVTTRGHQDIATNRTTKTSHPGQPGPSRRNATHPVAAPRSGPPTMRRHERYVRRTEDMVPCAPILHAS